ncbi:MAG: 4-(cytidine 5'-diphospho)-2-C-methyl-D-erythritol kinase, partial [Vicinamibacteria bacterium]
FESKLLIAVGMFCVVLSTLATNIAANIVSPANDFSNLAPAKINLFLSVGPRRGDGLHPIRSVMQAVSLYDDLAVEPADGVSFTVRPEGAAPEDESNLVVKAVRAFAASVGMGEGAITLTKRIPVAAGLAGGSADAAATLVALNKAWNGGLSRKALEKLGAAIGSDVPFCVRGGTALVMGAGEDLSPLGVREPVWWVLGIGDGALSTAEVYARFDALGGGPGIDDPYEAADGLAKGDVHRIAEGLRNDLEPAAFALAPGLEAGREALEKAGAVAAIMSGSGPTWCGLCRDEAHARDVAQAAAGSFARVEVVSSVSHGPAERSRA